MHGIEILIRLQHIPAGVYPTGTIVYWNLFGELCDSADALYKAVVGEDHVFSTTSGSIIDPDGITWI